MVLRILNVYFGLLCYVCGLISLSSWLCGFNVLIGPGFILSLVVNFLFFSNHFPVINLGLDMFSGAYLNRFTVSVVPSD